MNSPTPGLNSVETHLQSRETAPILPPAAPVGQYYVRFNLKNQNSGPFSELEIRSMIQNRELGITDLICEVGESKWTVLSESRFSSLVIGATSRSQLQSSTCPNCQAHMVVIMKSSTAATLLIVIGFFTAIAVIGLALILIGYIWRKKSRTAHYICPRCNYKT
jgi:predicted RNA-binding Zn-ribbon protein involved in translation (DUF1610 family)